MKLSLTITDASPEEIQKVVSFFSSSSSASTQMLTTTTAITPPSSSMPMPQNPNPDDGDNEPANSNAPTADSANFPWDARIHAKSKALNADGTWRKRRNIDANLVASVEAELRSRSAPPPQVQVYSAPPSAPPAYTPPMPNMAPPSAPPAYTPPQPYVQQQPAPPPQQMDFQQFMQHLTQRMQLRDQAGNPIIDAGYLASVVSRINAGMQRQFTAITDISSDVNAVNYAIAIMTQDQRW
jgi:hypothetical protein